MVELTEQAFAILRQQHGIISVSQLQAAGVGRNARRRMVEHGALVHEHRSVLRIASAAESLTSRCIVLCLAHPRAFITGPTGGRLMGLRRMPPPTPIHLAVPHGLHLPDADVKLRQTTRITPYDVHRLDNGIVVASYNRLAFDLAADLTALDHASVIEQLIQRGSVSVGSLAGMARRLCHPLRPGSRQFVDVLMERGGGKASESHPEVVLGRALRARGIPVEPQFTDLHLLDGSKIRLDLAVPSLRWGVEIDVHPYHLLLDGTSRDKRRDRKCHLIGWQVERVTELDLLDVETIADELLALFEARRRAVA